MFVLRESSRYSVLRVVKVHSLASSTRTTGTAICDKPCLPSTTVILAEVVSNPGAEVQFTYLTLRFARFLSDPVVILDSTC